MFVNVCVCALQSLKVLDEDYLRLPEEVVAARKAKPIHFKFPSPDDVASALRSITDPYSPVIRLTNAAVGYGRDTSTAVLSRLTLEVGPSPIFMRINLYTLFCDVLFSGVAEVAHFPRREEWMWEIYSVEAVPRSIASSHWT